MNGAEISQIILPTTWRHSVLRYATPVRLTTVVQIMENMKIIKVAELDDGRIAVYPATVDPIYEYIYREAAGVYWNRELGCFHLILTKDWNHQQWYGQIVTVVWSGLKIKLDLTPDTQFEGTPDNFKADIFSANADDQKWIHDHENR